MNTPNINQLFQNAQTEGLLSARALHSLTVNDIGAQIQAGLGIPAEDVPATEVILVTIMPDDSSSIDYNHNAQAVRGGHNSVIDVLMDCQQFASILIHNRYLNGKVLYPYCPVREAIRMDYQNYQPNQGTPLYDQTVVLLGTVLAKAQEFASYGIPVRTVTLIITDGADCHSTKYRPQEVAEIVKGMIAHENHIVAGMGIDDGDTDFRQVFRSMGILDRWILTPGNTETEISKAFQVFSRSVVRASQVGNLTNLGGF